MAMFLCLERRNICVCMPARVPGLLLPLLKLYDNKAWKEMALVCRSYFLPETHSSGGQPQRETDVLKIERQRDTCTVTQSRKSMFSLKTLRQNKENKEVVPKECLRDVALTTNS